MTVIVTIHDSNLGTGHVAFWAVLTTAVFWLVDVYMRVVDVGFARPRITFGVAKRAMRSEWPMLQAALIPAAVLVLGALNVIDDDVAINLSLYTGVVVLFGAGFLVGKRDGMEPKKSILIGVINAFIGLAIIGMKILI